MRLSPPIVIAALVLAAAAPVHAASKGGKADGEMCETYRHRVEDALAAHPGARKLEHAKTEQEAGEKACGAGQYDVGIKHYKTALRDLGVRAVKQQ